MSPPESNNPVPVLVTPALLRRMPLPRPDADTGGHDTGGKARRGQVLVVGGAPDLPGPIILAATAALRAGAGELRIATVESIAPLVGVTVPEARVFGLPQLPSGGIDPAASGRIAELAAKAQAIICGPGLTDEAAIPKLLTPVLHGIKDASVVLDAGALACVSHDFDSLRALTGRAVLTPHAVEMSLMLGLDETQVAADPTAIALEAASRFGAVVALKGAETHIATPSGSVSLSRAGNIGLAVSGSGDTLAGIVGGLLARGASAETAAVWGVFLHGRAGERLARRVGPLGFLAREILPEIPSLLRDLQQPRCRR